MLFRTAYLFIFFVTFAFALGAPALSDVPGPKKGDFGYPPEGYEKEEPGTILKSRKVNLYNFGIFKINATGYDVLYRTSAANESEPMATLMKVLVPDNPSKDKVVIHNTVEDASAYKCSPSASLGHSKFVNLQGPVSRFELLLVTVYLNAGWTVVVPDYEGPTAAFGVGPLAGHAVLDSARAVNNMQELDLEDDVKFVSVGYSGGAIATGWASQLHGSYAPDVNLVGTTFGGTPANLTELMLKVEGGSNAGIFANGAAGIINGTPDLQRQVTKIFNTKGIKLINWARKNCAALAFLPFVFRKYSDFFKGGKDLQEISEITNVLDRYRLGREDAPAPTAPVFMVHTTFDEFVPFKSAEKTAKKWCEIGANVEFQTQTFVSSHIATYIASFAEMMKFVKDRFDGKEFHGGKCHFNSIATPAFDIDDDLYFASVFIQAVKSLFGEALHHKN